ncbi:MAG TPA: phosphate-starvation-inducible protein PsiE [Thermopetrobacter sp.]|nr:phosphate-starvation-inducible protein PsiE [Thermopetrobacter sp.]
MDRSFSRHIDPLGNLLVDLFHYGALFAIGAVTVIASAHEIMRTFAEGPATIEDLLLLFIYLEIGAMVGIYFRTYRMPVRFLVYVAITALTRLLIGEAGKHEAGSASTTYADMLWIAAATLLLAVALLLLRYGSARFPSPPSDHESILRRQSRRVSSAAQEESRHERATDAP